MLLVLANYGHHMGWKTWGLARRSAGLGSAARSVLVGRGVSVHLPLAHVRPASMGEDVCVDYVNLLGLTPIEPTAKEGDARDHNYGGIQNRVESTSK